MARQLEDEEFEHNPFPGTVPHHEPPGFEQRGPIAPRNLPEEDDLSFLEGEGWVRVNRQGPDGDFLMIKKLERKVLADDITFIGKTWGGGRYWLEVQDAQRRWVRKFYVNFDPKEYGLPKGAAVVQKVDPATGTPIIIEQGAAPGPDPRLAEEMRLTREAQDRKDSEIRALNERMLTAQAQNNKDMLAMVEKVLLRPKADGFEDLQRFAQMKDLLGLGESRRGEGLGDVLKAMLPELSEAFKNWLTKSSTTQIVAGPAPENSTPLERMILPLVQAFAPVIARGVTAQGAASKPPLRRAPQPVPVNPAPATGQPFNKPAALEGNGHRVHSEPGKEGESTLLDQIKGHPVTKLVAPMLLSTAKSGTSPEDAAQEIADLVPDKYWDVVVQLVNRPDMVQYLAIFEPEVANYGPWFTSVADVLKRDFIEEAESGDDTDDLAPPTASSVEGDELEGSSPPVVIAPEGTRVPSEEGKVDGK